MIKSIFLKISIFLVAFMVLCTSVVVSAADNSIVGTWIAKTDRIWFYEDVRIDGHIILDGFQDSINNEFGRDYVDSISIDFVNNEWDGNVDFEFSFWIDDFEEPFVLATGSIYYSDFDDPSTFELTSFKWEGDSVTSIQIVSADSASSNAFDFLDFNFVREVVEPTNIYQTCYDLLNTWVFGGTVVQGSFHDLVLILISTICVLLLVALPMLIVWRIIRIWM